MPDFFKDKPHPLTVRLSSDVKRGLFAAAKEEGRSWSNMADRLLRRCLTEDGHISESDSTPDPES